jgi:uncharacterized membrane protein
LAGLLGIVAPLHFVAGDVLEAALPRWVPAKRAMVYGSGVLEMVCALGLVRRKPWAGPLSAAVLIAIWPANIQMALDAGTGRHSGIFDNATLMWARVPMQLPMIWVAWRSTHLRRSLPGSKTKNN